MIGAGLRPTVQRGPVRHAEWLPAVPATGLAPGGVCSPLSLGTDNSRTAFGKVEFEWVQRHSCYASGSGYRNR